MRVNIYSQEIDLNCPPEITVKEGRNEAGEMESFYGVRFYLHSAPQLHDNATDDDRSAVTFWIPQSVTNRQALAALFNEAANAVIGTGNYARLIPMAIPNKPLYRGGPTIRRGEDD